MIKQKIEAFKKGTGKTIALVVKVLFYEVVLALVVMGVLYATNFRINIVPLVTTISPISTEK